MWKILSFPYKGKNLISLRFICGRLYDEPAVGSVVISAVQKSRRQKQPVTQQIEKLSSHAHIIVMKQNVYKFKRHTDSPPSP